MALTATRGATSEYLAAAYFSSNGYEVFWPNGCSSAADFVADRSGVSFRVQVKTASWVEYRGVSYLRANLRSSRSSYKPGDYDLLAAVARDGRIWVIPFEDLPKKSTLYLERSGGRAKDYGWGGYLVVP